MNNQKLRQRVREMAAELVSSKGNVCSVDLLLKLEYLTWKDYEDWRFNR